MADLVNYEGKRVLVVGGATGMGAAAAQKAASLGAHTIVLDIADVAYECGQYIHVNLGDQASVDAAVEAIEGPVHTVLACAGVADGTGNLMLINFTSQRHLIEALVKGGKLGRGGSVSFISSAAGLGWMSNLEQVQDFLATPDWDTAAAWIDENEGTDSYMFSKQAINGYVAGQAFPFLQRGIRINSIMPGPTDNPLGSGQRRSVARIRGELPGSRRCAHPGSRTDGRHPAVFEQRRGQRDQRDQPAGRPGPHQCLASGRLGRPVCEGHGRHDGFRPGHVRDGRVSRRTR